MPKLTHSEATQLMTDDWDADRENRARGQEDLSAVAGDGQWTSEEKSAREAAKRPCLTINRLSGVVSQVVNDIKQAQAAIEVFPVDSEENKGVADVYEGLIRQIEYRSKAQSVYGYGAWCAASCGLGHWRIVNEFAKDSVFEQELKIKRIVDPLSVVWGADADEIDRSDSTRCWVTELVHKTNYEKRFGKAFNPTSVPHQGELDWYEDDFVRIAEYWYIEDTEREFVLTNDGETLDITDWDEVEKIQLFNSGIVIDAAKGPSQKVWRRSFDGSDWLEEPQEWAGKHIPIIPVMGHEVVSNGRTQRKSLIRDAKDSQRLYNFWASQSAEAIAKAPTAPWLVSQDMVKGLQPYWKNANNSTLPYLPYNPDPKAPGAMPKRQDPPQIPSSLWQERLNAAEDIKATTGIFDASLGAKSNETSGKAIEARQREGDVGSYHFFDNYQTAIWRTGEVLVDLIPRIYDTDRVIRVLGKDDSENFVPINRAVMSADGEQMLVNDLSHGRFDVRVKTGASYTTARVEAREQMAIAMQSNPQLWTVMGDLFFKNSDYPGAEEISERMRRAIPPELLEDRDENEPPQPDPRAEAIAQIDLAKGQAEVLDIQASARKKAAEAEHTELETQAGAFELGVATG